MSIVKNPYHLTAPKARLGRAEQRLSDLRYRLDRVEQHLGIEQPLHSKLDTPAPTTPEDAGTSEA